MLLLFSLEKGRVRVALTGYICLLIWALAGHRRENMSQAQHRFLASPKQEMEVRPYSVRTDVTNSTREDSHPYLERAVRVFGSSRKFTKEEIRYFVGAFEEGYYQEMSSYSSSNHRYLNFLGTLRYARRSFWKLVYLDKLRVASKLTVSLSDFTEKRRRSLRIESYDKPEEKNRKTAEEKRLQACQNALALFMVQRFVQDDVGINFWNGQAFKAFLVIVGRSSSETQLEIMGELAKYFHQKVRSFRSAERKHVNHDIWVYLRLLFMGFMSGQLEASDAAKRLVGELLANLRTAEYEHSERSYRDEDLPNSVALREYVASIAVVLQSTHKWLCGKELKLDIQPYGCSLID